PSGKEGEVGHAGECAGWSINKEAAEHVSAIPAFPSELDHDFFRVSLSQQLHGLGNACKSLPVRARIDKDPPPRPSGSDRGRNRREASAFGITLDLDASE